MNLLSELVHAVFVMLEVLNGQKASGHGGRVTKVRQHSAGGVRRWRTSRYGGFDTEKVWSTTSADCFNASRCRCATKLPSETYEEVSLEEVGKAATLATPFLVLRVLEAGSLAWMITTHLVGLYFGSQAHRDSTRWRVPDAPASATVGPERKGVFEAR